MKLKPVQDQVIVRLDAFENNFEDSGIIRPGIAKEKPVWGEVLGVGPGNVSKKGVLIPTTLNTGDRVYVPWSTGSDVMQGDRMLVIVREHQIMAVADAG